MAVILQLYFLGGSQVAQVNPLSSFEVVQVRPIEKWIAVYFQRLRLLDGERRVQIAALGHPRNSFHHASKRRLTFNFSNAL